MSSIQFVISHSIPAEGRSIIPIPATAFNSFLLLPSSFTVHRTQEWLCLVCVWEFCSPDLDFPRAIVCRSLGQKLGPPRLRNRTKTPEKPAGIGSLLFRPFSHPFPFSDIIPSSSSSDLRRLISSLRLPLPPVLFAVIPSSHFPGLTPNQSACY
ncbi:hypothetical protein ASPTUDRAFT_360099 [Aspergillus tubingensis CBS 134.48]|uniref:Uncharacterized protein n=1 Tax=Aspergillus tubingensis (strain CBS 134.48) TaxID=767770 RepID=A0A1L9NI92_ASPTC|nr:hypothetical protein ASPTUDRAFT_360099 [Aspergillus tubingensis CBS 134.48]